MNNSELDIKSNKQFIGRDNQQESDDKVFYLNSILQYSFMEAHSFLKKPHALDPIQLTVLHKKGSLPPNQIITKEYSPDVKPQVRLITKQQLQKSEKNISYVPPRIKNIEFQKYGQQFHPQDFLGYKYAEEFDQMVYFRYNNEQFNQLTDNNTGKATKFFGGLFIPPQALQSKQLKVQDSIYAALNLSAPEIRDSIAQSFSKNSKGCSFDPLFSSNYTSANMMAAIRKQPFDYDIILQNDTNCKSAQWFNFAVKFIEEGTYTFNIVNLTHDNPLYGMGMKIPYFSYMQQSLKSDLSDSIKSGNGWSFGGKNVRFAKTDLRKQNQLLDQTYFSLSFEFKCKNRQQIVVFASSIPYTSLDYERFLNRVLFNKIGQHMKMQKIEICQTIAGSPLSAYVFYHRKSKSNTMMLKNTSEDRPLDNYRSSQRHKTLNLSSQNANSFISQPPLLQTSVSNGTRSIVFMARQRSGQTPSSFVLEGVLQFLMDNTEFDLFKKNFQFVIIPFVNPDGVKYGNQRVNLAGTDLDKCWRNPNETFQPQVFHVKKFLRKVNQIHPISMLVNLSSNNQCLSCNFTSGSIKKYCDQVPQLFPYICSKRVPQISFHKTEFLPSHKQSLVSNLSEVFPKCLVYEFSVSDYGWKQENSGFRRYTESSLSEDETAINQFTPDIYRTMGRQIITTYLEYVRLCEKNIGIRDRWLREIEELPSVLSSQRKQSILLQKKHQQSWDRELVRFDYSLYCPPEESKLQKSEGRKHKTTLLYRYSGSHSNQFRSKQKKLTMPNIKNSRFSKEQKQNTLMTSSQPQPQLHSSKDSQMDTLLKKLKKSPLSSSVFTPQRKSQILKEISESIKQSEVDKQSSFIASNNVSSLNLQKIVQKKQKRISRLMFEQKSQASLIPKNLVLKQEDEQKNKIDNAITKFQNMKKFISTVGIRAEGRSSGMERA